MVNKGLNSTAKPQICLYFGAYDSIKLALPFRDKKYRAKVGLKVFNVTRHFNPHDFQGNLASSSFGGFFNGVDRSIRGKFVIEF